MEVPLRLQVGSSVAPVGEVLRVHAPRVMVLE
jgi:hypothetical protein